MKKGSLNLSINAIVVLILAITMLGLGLAFMRSMFTGATDELTGSLKGIEQERIDTFLAKCADDVCIESTLSLKKNSEEKILAAIFNKFECDIDEYQAFDDDPAGSWTAGGASIVIDSSQCKVVGDAPNCDAIEIYAIDVQKVPEFEKTTIPIRIKAKSTAVPGIYRYPMTVKGRCAGNNDYMIKEQVWFDVEIEG